MEKKNTKRKTETRIEKTTKTTTRLINNLLLTPIKQLLQYCVYAPKL